MRKLILCTAVVLALLAACLPEEITPQMQAPTRHPENYAPGVTYVPATVSGREDWPDRPITVIVPFLAGGDTDMYARMLQPFLAEILGQPVNVANVDGASGNIGAMQVRNAEPDGYTVLFYHTGTMFTNYLAGNSTLNYTSFDLISVAIYCDANIMVISPDLGFDNGRDFLVHVRDNPYAVSLAIVTNTFSHSLANVAEEAGGFQLYHINVGSGAVKAASVINGHTDAAYNNMALFLPYIERGELIPLWIGSAQRNPRLPDVPALAELGIRDGYIGRSYFFAFPPGVDPDIIAGFSGAVRQATENPFFREELFGVMNLEPQFVPHDLINGYMFDRWRHYAELEDILLD